MRVCVAILAASFFSPWRSTVVPRCCVHVKRRLVPLNARTRCVMVKDAVALASGQR